MSSQPDLKSFIDGLVASGAELSDHAYDILRVHPSAEQDVIEAAYRRLLRLYHPDVNRSPEANEVTKIIITSYGIVGDPEKRAAYDSYLASVGRTGSSREEDGKYERPETRGEAAHHFSHGLDYAMEGNLDLAIESLTIAIRLDPNESSFYGARGSVYRTLGEVDLALLDLNVALTGDLNVAHHYFERSYVYEEIGNLEAAIADLSKAMELSPQDYNIPSFEGRLARLKEALTQSQPTAQPPTYRRTKWDRNVLKYTEAINLNPHRSSNYKFRGNAYLKKGEFELALTDFDKAIELNPSSPSNYDHRAKAYTYLGELVLAEEDVNTAEQLRTQQESVSSTGNTLRPDANESITAAYQTTRAQPADDSASIWDQAHNLSSDTKAAGNGRNYSLRRRASSAFAEYALAIVVYLAVSSLTMGALVIFWNETAAGIASAIFGILVLLFTWVNDTTGRGAKAFITVSGFILMISLSLLESHIFNSSGFIGAAVGLGAAFGFVVVFNGEKNESS